MSVGLNLFMPHSSSSCLCPPAATLILQVHCVVRDGQHWLLIPCLPQACLLLTSTGTNMQPAYLCICLYSLHAQVYQQHKPAFGGFCRHSHSNMAECCQSKPHQKLKLLPKQQSPSLRGFSSSQSRGPVRRPLSRGLSGITAVRSFSASCMVHLKG